MESLDKPSAAAGRPEQPANAQYEAIVQRCRKSEEILARSIRPGLPLLETVYTNISTFRPNGQAAPEMLLLLRALMDFQSHEAIWKEYSAGTQGAVEFRHADFSRLCFVFARMKEHHFIECDFRGSVWSFCTIENSEFSGSDFTGVAAFTLPFAHTDCSGCNFTNAQIMTFDPAHGNNFQHAIFTNARLFSSHSFFHAENLASKSRFDGAVMNGAKLLIQKEAPAQHNRSRGELESFVRQIFSPEQLAVMHIDYDVGGFLGRLGGLRR